ncbi:MAG TPA: response regulator [Burkholderiales bacterium]|nr:response regulator [Burkholderiales bacterium]
MQQSPKKPLVILLVEDNPADVRMTREALKLARIEHELHVAADGEQALAFIRKEGEYAQAPDPDLMLLDLSIPRLDGHGVLAQLRPPRAERRFPVVVITGSRLQSDLETSFKLDADEHITKPASVLHYASELMFACGLARPRS